MLILGLLEPRNVCLIILEVVSMRQRWHRFRSSWVLWEIIYSSPLPTFCYWARNPWNCMPYRVIARISVLIFINIIFSVMYISKFNLFLKKQLQFYSGPSLYLDVNLILCDTLCIPLNNVISEVLGDYTTTYKF